MTIRFFEDVEKGEQLPELVKGPMTTMHIMRWSAAIENWHRIHFDQPFAVQHDGLPNVLVNGSWKQHVLAQLLKDWGGSGGWLHELKFRYLGMDVVGNTVTALGSVRDTSRDGDRGKVVCDVSLKNQAGEVTTEGRAVVYLPLRSAPATGDVASAGSPASSERGSVENAVGGHDD